MYKTTEVLYSAHETEQWQRIKEPVATALSNYGAGNPSSAVGTREFNISGRTYEIKASSVKQIDDHLFFITSLIREKDVISMVALYDSAGQPIATDGVIPYSKIYTVLSTKNGIGASTVALDIYAPEAVLSSACPDIDAAINNERIFYPDITKDGVKYVNHMLTYPVDTLMVQYPPYLRDEQFYSGNDLVKEIERVSSVEEYQIITKVKSPNWLTRAWKKIVSRKHPQPDKLTYHRLSDNASVLFAHHGWIQSDNEHDIENHLKNLVTTRENNTQIKK